MAVPTVLAVVQKRYSIIVMEDSAAFREPRILSDMEHADVARVLQAQWDPDMENAITFVTVYCERRCIAKVQDEDYRFSTRPAPSFSASIPIASPPARTASPKT